jgi:hypothetical protein
MIATNYSIEYGCLNEIRREEIEEIIKSNVRPLFPEDTYDGEIDFPEVIVERNNTHTLRQVSNEEILRWNQRNRVRNQSRTFLTNEEIQTGFVRNNSISNEFIGPISRPEDFIEEDIENVLIGDNNNNSTQIIEGLIGNISQNNHLTQTSITEEVIIIENVIESLSQNNDLTQTSITEEEIIIENVIESLSQNNILQNNSLNNNSNNSIDNNSINSSINDNSINDNSINNNSINSLVESSLINNTPNNNSINLNNNNSITLLI